MFRYLLPLVTLVVLMSSIPQPAAGQSGDRASAKAAAPSGVVVNLNTASASDFEALPGIGAKTAARIIEYRQKNGPFKKVEDLMNVRGIGEKNFLKLKPQITVSAAKTETASARQN
jgi:competence protein ComEA